MEPNEIRIHYVTHFLKLSLWYVHRLLQIEGGLFADVVNARVNIYRNTNFYEGGNKVPSRGHVDLAWNEYLEGLKAIFDRHITDTGKLEEEGLAYLWPRVIKTGGRASANRRPYECWTFDDGEDYIAIHIANVYQPKSPLSDMRIPFAASLLRLLGDTQQRRPEVKMVRCGSWMNSVPPFQAMFPESWHKSAVLSPRSGFGMGHWGQFADRVGRFHERNGAKLRETGDFPNPSLSCRAPIDEIVFHLRQHFPEAVVYNEQKNGNSGV